MEHHLLNSIGFQISLLLAIALGGYLLSAITRQSAVVWQILLGIMIGPSLFNFITYTGFVENLAYLGGVILLFVIGLEFKLKDLVSYKSALIALMGVIVPWVLAYLTARFFSFSTHSSIFIGTALTATSIAITANVLYELGILRSNLAKVIIGAAVIDDILALFALSITTNLLSGSISAYELALLAFKISVFLVIGLLIGYYLITKVIYAIDNSKFAQSYSEVVFIFAMAVAFTYALIAELLGISAIIGAFISGVFMEGITLKNSRHFRDGADYLRIIFASVFFVSLGILVDLSQINTQIIYFITTLVIIALASKTIGCGLTAKFCRYNWTESFAIGVGMSPRGEVAMIIALIGLNKHIIEQPVYISIVLMSLITTIITPIILTKLLSAKL